MSATLRYRFGKVSGHRWRTIGAKVIRAICFPRQNVRASEAEKNREEGQTKSPPSSSSSFEREMLTIPVVEFRVPRISVANATFGTLWILIGERFAASARGWSAVFYWSRNAETRFRLHGKLSFRYFAFTSNDERDIPIYCFSYLNLSFFYSIFIWSYLTLE